MASQGLPVEGRQKLAQLLSDLEQGALSQEMFDNKKKKLYIEFGLLDQSGSATPQTRMSPQTERAALGKQTSGALSPNTVASRKVSGELKPNSPLGSPSGARSQNNSSSNLMGSPEHPRRPTGVINRRETILPMAPSEAEQTGTNRKITDRLGLLMEAMRKQSEPKKKYLIASSPKVSERPADAPEPTGEVLLPITGQPVRKEQDPLRVADLAPITNMAEILRWRATTHPKRIAFSQLNAKGGEAAKLNYLQLNHDVESISHALKSKFACEHRQRVALVFSEHEVIPFVKAFFGCLHAGVIPVMVSLPSESGSESQVAHDGFLLETCAVRIALSTAATIDAMPHEDKAIKVKGWPKLTWHNSVGLKHPGKNKSAPPYECGPATPALIEATVSSSGNVKAVVHSHVSLIAHSAAIADSFGLLSNHMLLSTLSFRSRVGLTHAVIGAVFVGAHAMYLSYFDFAAAPSILLAALAKFKINFLYTSYAALSKCNAEGAPPKGAKFELLSCMLDEPKTNAAVSDEFVKKFAFNPTVICPVLYTPESKTVGGKLIGKEMFEMSVDLKSLSFDVCRVRPRHTAGSLLLQNSGSVLPRSLCCAVTLGADPVLCKTDQVGEICVSNLGTGMMYYGLKGVTVKTFQVYPTHPRGDAVPQYPFVRTGYIGFFSQNNTIFVTGKVEDVIVSGGYRNFNSEDVERAVLLASPQIAFKNRVVAIPVEIFEDERVFIVAETPMESEDIIQAWTVTITEVLQRATGLAVYCVLLVQPDGLPMTRDIVDKNELKRQLMHGLLHPKFVNMNVGSVINLPPKFVRKSHGVGMQLGDLLKAQTSGGILVGAAPNRVMLDESSKVNLDNYSFLPQVLEWRAKTFPKHQLFTFVDDKAETKSVTIEEFFGRVQRGAHFLEKNSIGKEAMVVLLMAPCIDLLVMIHACMFVGVIPIPVEPVNAAKIKSDVSKLAQIANIGVVALIADDDSRKLFKEKDGKYYVDMVRFPFAVYSIDDAKLTKKPDNIIAYVPPSSPKATALVEFSVTASGAMAGCRVSHEALLSTCRNQKQTYELGPTKPVVLCVQPYDGLGLRYHAAVSVYVGYLSTIISDSHLHQAPSLWFSTLYSTKARHTVVSYNAIELCVAKLATYKFEGINLSLVRSMLVHVTERPRSHSTTQLAVTFQKIGLRPDCMLTSFGCEINPIISQETTTSDLNPVYIDVEQLRKDIFEVVERGSPDSACLSSCGVAVPGTAVAIVDIDSQIPCRSHEVGEIWVQSALSSGSYFGMDEAMSRHYFNRALDGLQGSWTRTSYLGCIYKNRLFVTGAVEETFVVDGYRHYSADVEHTVQQAHKVLETGSNAVFSTKDTVNEACVCVCEVPATTDQAMLLSLVPIVTSAILAEHKIVVHVIAFTPLNVIPRNTKDQKLRDQLLSMFLSGNMQVLHIAYNV